MQTLPRTPALLAVLTLGLSACNTSTPPGASDQPVVTTIQGRVTRPNGTGTVSATGLGTVTSLAEDGRFALSLPGPDGMTGRTLSLETVVRTLKCTGSPTSSAEGNRGYGVAVLDVTDHAGLRQVLAVEGSQPNPLARNVTARAWLYAEKDARLGGEIDCSELLGGAVDRVPVRLEANVKRGWNVLRLDIGASVGLGGTSAGGSLSNATDGESVTTWRTQEELKAQLGF